MPGVFRQIPRIPWLRPRTPLVELAPPTVVSVNGTTAAIAWSTSTATGSVLTIISAATAGTPTATPLYGATPTAAALYGATPTAAAKYGANTPTAVAA